MKSSDAMEDAKLFKTPAFFESARARESTAVSEPRGVKALCTSASTNPIVRSAAVQFSPEECVVKPKVIGAERRMLPFVSSLQAVRKLRLRKIKIKKNKLKVNGHANVSIVVVVAGGMELHRTCSSKGQRREPCY